MQRWYKADLHIHTALSPCAAHEMSPPLIVKAAIEAGLDMIAITDHNSTGNVLAVQQAAQYTDLLVLAGVEIQTIEEVHLICLLPNFNQAKAIQDLINQSLPNCQNRSDYFGQQLLFDYKGNIIGFEERLLLNSCNMTVNEVVYEVNKAHGLVIPAHIDRSAYSILELLGFIPPNQFIALEISSSALQKNQVQQYFSFNYPLIISSDAHDLKQIGQYKSSFYLAGLNLPALIDYLKK